MNRISVRPLVWVVAAVAVTATATALITASLVADGPVLSPEEVDRALAAGTSTPTVTTTGTATVTGGAGDVVVSTLTPGIVTVQCDGDVATLISWSPNPGWRADDPVRGPAAEVSVRFESDVAADYKITASCVGGAAVVQQGPDDDDHGGGGRGGADDNSGPGGGGDDY
jgi:serine/threonine-protein kinase